jgi:hypothetical protein
MPERHGEITARRRSRWLNWHGLCELPPETKVDFNYSAGKGNQFTAFTKSHNDIKTGKMDGTVADIGVMMFEMPLLNVEI